MEPAGIRHCKLRAGNSAFPACGVLVFCLSFARISGGTIGVQTMMVCTPRVGSPRGASPASSALNRLVWRFR
jgi:hypothetical protein